MVERPASDPAAGVVGDLETVAPERRRWLVLRFHSLGDVILASGILKGLSSLPTRPLVEFVTEKKFAPLFAGSPFVSWVHFREGDVPRLGLYDRVVDLQASPSSRKFLGRGQSPDAGPDDEPEVRSVRTRSLQRRLLVLTGGRGPGGIPDAIDRYAEAAFLPGEREALGALDLAPELYEDEVGQAEWAEHAGARLSGPCVALITGASRRSKAPSRATFTAVGREFQSRGWNVLWVEEEKGSPSEAPVGTRVAVSLAGLKSALASSDLVVSGDSGPMHLATAMNVPVVAVFGSSVRGFGFYPRGRRTRVLERDVWCRPCGVHGRNRCWRGGFPCLDIPPERIVEEGLQLRELSGEPGRTSPPGDTEEGAS